MQRLVFACALFLLCPLSSAWLPPGKPDPGAILREAREDRAQKRYADALAKHLWFHNEALRIDPAFAGVRLSFALGDWGILASRYEPAMAALKEVRDRAAADVRAGHDAASAFNEFAAINRELDGEQLTRELFTWLESSNPALARVVYTSAENALLEGGDYVTCGRYMDPAAALARTIDIHHQMTAFRKDRSAPGFDAVAERYFARDVSKIVALLVLNNRRPEAEKIVRDARQAFDSPAVDAALKRALEGAMPESLVTRDQRKALRALMP